jgi:thiosulfate dehydrogenase
VTAARMIAAASLGVIAAAMIAACGDNGPTPAVAFGAQIFSDPRLADNPDNVYSCATCHDATGAPDPARIYPGYTLYDSAFRASWWGGYEAELLLAVNFCYQSFMGAPVPLARDEPKAKALYEYLASISPTRPAPARPLTFQRYVLSFPPGDAARGEQVYAGACASCHGALGTGDQRLSKDIPRLPDAIDAVAKKYPNSAPSVLVIEKVRHGQFWGIGGNSPPFPREAMADEDLAALLGYLGR